MNPLHHLPYAAKVAASLPLRPVARVVIMKNGKLCLGRVWNEHGRLGYYTFPGGGVEPGDTQLATIMKKSLEEVGMVINNIRKLDLVVDARHPMGTAERNQRWGGTSTQYFVADWERYDYTQRGQSAELMHYTWEKPAKAIGIINAGPDVAFNDIRIQAIELAAATAVAA